MLRETFTQGNLSMTVALLVVLVLGIDRGAEGQSAVSEPLAAAQKHLDAGHPSAALKAFKTLDDINQGRCVPCLLGMAESQLRLHEEQDAVKSCERALRVADTPPALRARAHSLTATALLRGRTDRSTFERIEKELRLALEADPGDPVSHFTLGYALMRQRRDAEGIAELRRMLELKPPAAAAAEAERLIADPRRARERFAPDFSVVTLKGETVSLERLAGKWVVLDFWATWCPPCVAAVSELKDLVRKYPPDQLVLLSISADEDEEKWKRFLDRERITWPQYRDANHGLQLLFEVRAYPTYLVLDGEGRVVREIVGTDPQKSVAYRLKETLKELDGSRAR